MSADSAHACYGGWGRRDCTQRVRFEVLADPEVRPKWACPKHLAPVVKDSCRVHGKAIVLPVPAPPLLPSDPSQTSAPVDAQPDASLVESSAHSSEVEP